MFSKGKIIANSPADLSGQLKVNDRILAVNNIDLTLMSHKDIVDLIKDSGRMITLKIAPANPTGSLFSQFESKLSIFLV